MDNQKQHRLLMIIGLTGLLVTALYAYGHEVDGDVFQLLQLGHSFVVKKVLIPFGSFSSSGVSGNVPGPLLSLFIGLPMKIWHSPWSALLFLALLHLAALMMMMHVMKNYISPTALLALTVLFWLNPWRASEVFLWNPGYIYFASVFHFWTAHHLADRSSFGFSMLHTISIFIALQIHASFVILVFATLLLLKMRAIQANWKGVACGVIVGLAFLAPYFLAGLQDPRIFPQPGSGGKGHLFFGLVRVYPLLKGFWYWILFGTPIFQKHIFHQLEYGWIQPAGLQLAFTYFWTVVKYGIGLAGVILSFYVNYRFFRANKPAFRFWRSRFSGRESWVNYYIVAMFVAAMISVAISPTLPIYWHLLFVWPASLLPLVFFIDGHCSAAHKIGRIKTVILLCAVYFTVFNIVGALGSHKHSIYTNFHRTYHTICTDECNWPAEGQKAQ